MIDLILLTKRILNFPKKSPRERLGSYAYRWLRWFPGTPAPVRLPSGDWWLIDADFIGHSLLEGGYESAECNFERRFINPGMTVLDIGAHRGFHTLLLSKSVGRRGRVLAFEPSPSDLKRLRLHVAINFCRNVKVLPCALGGQDGSATLYVTEANTVQNSLRPQLTVSPGTPTTVAVRRLDGALSQLGIGKVDYLKLDVEGAELTVLKGAERLLSALPRPVILCEVLEETTRAWGYLAREIVEHLSARGFVWFGLNEEAELVPVDHERSEFHGNFVAVPTETLKAVAHLLAPANCNTN